METKEEVMYGGFFTDHDAQGKAYMGYEYHDGAISVRTFLGNRETAADVRTAFLACLNDLKETPDKLIEVKGMGDAGLRAT